MRTTGHDAGLASPARKSRTNSVTGSTSSPTASVIVNGTPGSLVVTTLPTTGSASRARSRTAGTGNSLIPTLTRRQPSEQLISNGT
jgi:hypothetical protein